MAAIRKARAVWTGDLAHGKGALTAESSGLFKEAAVTWASRTERSDGKTSPEELLAAAHASCFAMALSFGLGNAGKPPQRLEVTATVTFEQVPGGFKVKSSALEVTGTVPGLDAAGFQKAAEGAKDGCPISQALKGNVELSVKAQLAS
jgi:osmotically inducible protein OsmC